MATLKAVKTEEELKGMTVSNVKKAYLDIANSYTSIIDNKMCFCPKCGKWLSSHSFYQNKNNADNLEHWGCKKDIVLGGCDYDKTTDTLTDNKEKAIHMCRVLDWVFVEKVYDDQVRSCIDGLSEKNRSTGWQQYIVMISSLPQYKNKTFENSEFLDVKDAIDNNSNRKPRKEIIRLFGRGFSTEDYLYLQDQYDDWKSRVQIDSKSQETYMMRICFKLLDIWKAQKIGKDTDKLDKSLNDLMSAANLQPKQNVGNAATDSLTFGQLIEKWEMEKPISEPDEEFKDVNNIGKLLRVFFSGHLSRALGLKNAYSKEYEEEMAKYTVTKPESQDEGGSSEIYDYLFGSTEEVD